MHGMAAVTDQKRINELVAQTGDQRWSDKDAERAGAELLALMKEIVRRAIVTLWTLKDPDRRYQSTNMAGWLLSTVRERSESYGWAEYGFEPQAHDISQMEIVAGWLAWLRRTEGEQAIRRLIGWTLGVRTWKLGKREGCSDQTIRNRIDRSITAIIRQFVGADISVEIVEDPKVTKPYSMVTEPNVVTDQPVVLRKVYIYDKGFYLGGKRWRDGREKAGKFLD